MRGLQPLPGARASRNPITSFPAGFGALTAGPNGVILGRFGWIIQPSGQVSNLFTPGALLGFVLPTYRMADWQRVYWTADPASQCCGPQVPVLRSGNGVILATQGDFCTTFAEGAQAGDHVYANPLDGSAHSFDAGGYIDTPWIVMSGCACGETGKISSWNKRAFNG